MSVSFKSVLVHSINYEFHLVFGAFGSFKYRFIRGVKRTVSFESQKHMDQYEIVKK